jgi:hypothetical protein
MTDTAVELDERYGRTPRRKRLDKWIYIGGGIAVALVVTAWVIWAGLDQAGASLETQDIGSKIVSSSTVQINYQISMTTGSTAKCALQVENSDHAITGWKIVDIPASPRFTNNFSTLVRTSEKPTTGLIYQCWLT